MLNLKLCRKRLYPSESVQYLGITIDGNLNWKVHVNDIASKLIRGNAILSKLRYFVKKDTLRSVYFAVFHSYIYMSCLGDHQATTAKNISSSKKSIKDNAFC